MSGESRGVAGARVLIWDLPTRLFHWSLVLAVSLALVTGFSGGSLMALHGRAGLAVVGLLAFRLAWGLVGGQHARFVNFVRGPAVIRAYLRGEWHGEGHNPLGALSVLGLLAVLGAQAASGLFANDDIAFNGFLSSLVTKETSDYLTGWHVRIIWLALGLVALHLAAIGFYGHVRRENLIKPMILGWKEGQAPDAGRAGPLAILFACGLAAALVWVASGGLNPPALPPAPVETPAW